MNNKKYQQNIIKAMKMLADKGYLFIGQTVIYGGSPMFGSLKKVPMKQRIEFPVAENTQMGVSTGMALEGLKVCSIFPRINFLICAVDQLVNHLDKIEEMSQGEFKPGVIIRTQIGSDYPIDGGLQHTGDYSYGLQELCKNIPVLKIEDENEVILFYKIALERAEQGQSTVLVEMPSGAFK